ncbi:MAG: hypothetical protein RL264_2205 [Bacteroidota bacterium]|jgi:hypothetical protein
MGRKILRIFRVNLTAEEFNDLGQMIKSQLELQGFEVEIKNVIRGAFHCHVRFPGLLLKSGLSGYQEEKILIQLDTEAQGYNFQSEPFYLNKFDVFTSIKIAPLLLAQKFYAVLNRKRNKGRDFFDIVYLLSLNVKPGFAFLEQKQGITNGTQLKSTILEHCQQLDMLEMANDVAPFLFNANDVKKIQHFEAFLEMENL